MTPFLWHKFYQNSPSKKDINQGTLVVFLNDSSVTNNELHSIFNVYGEIKEVSLVSNLFIAQILIRIICVLILSS